MTAKAMGKAFALYRQLHIPLQRPWERPLLFQTAAYSDSGSLLYLRQNTAALWVHLQATEEPMGRVIASFQAIAEPMGRASYLQVRQMGTGGF